MVGVPKSLVTTGEAAVPSDVTNQTVYITGIHNAHSATATVREFQPESSSTPSNWLAMAKVKSGASFTPTNPIKMKVEKKVYCDVADVTITYVVEGGPTITGPAGLTFTSTSY